MSEANREVRRRRKAAAEYLTEVHSLPTAPATLAKLACVGGGPEFEKAGRYPVYTQASLDAWAESRIRGPFKSTSEAKVSADSRRDAGVSLGAAA